MVQITHILSALAVMASAVSATPVVTPTEPISAAGKLWPIPPDVNITGPGPTCHANNLREFANECRDWLYKVKPGMNCGHHSVRVYCYDPEKRKHCEPCGEGFHCGLVCDTPGGPSEDDDKVTLEDLM